MKIRALLTLTLLSAVQAGAQTWVADSVDMTPTYANDVFYSLKTGNKSSAGIANWHLGFQMTTFGELSFNAAVRANHAKGKVEVYSLHRHASDFATITGTDTVGLTNPVLQQNNNDTSWGEGAFIQNRGTSLFDYGWGKYDPTDNHKVKGDSVFLVKVGTAAYKLVIDEYVSMGADIGYTFRIAALDGSSNNTVNIKRNSSGNDFTKRLFGYYNITTNTIVDREPNRDDWDMLFTQYVVHGYFGPVPGMLQALTGVLINENTQVAEIRATSLNPDTVTYTNYLSSFKRDKNTIGDDWKRFTGMTYVMIDTVAYFIKNNAGDYYQVKFTRFDGTATGKTVFMKRKVAVSQNVNDVTKQVSAFAIVPNPSTGSNTSIMVDVKQQATAQLVITDMMGRVVANNNVNLNAGLNGISVNTGSLTTGNYMVTITNGSWKMSGKLAVQH